MACVFYGFFFPEKFGGMLDEFVRSSDYDNMSMFEMMRSLFINNSKVAGMVVLFGVTIVVPLFILVANGVLIGAAIERASESVSWWDIVYNIAPHGIFEIPAMILAFAVGYRIAKAWFKKNRLHNIWGRFKDAVIVYVCVIIPLLFIASMIEGVLLWNAVNQSD